MRHRAHTNVDAEMLSLPVNLEHVFVEEKVNDCGRSHILKNELDGA